MRRDGTLHAGNSGEGLRIQAGKSRLGSSVNLPQPPTNTQAYYRYTVNCAARQLIVHQDYPVHAGCRYIGCTTTMIRKVFLQDCCMLLIAAQEVLKPGGWDGPDERGEPMRC
jgi:hypothetical protein